MDKLITDIAGGFPFHLDDFRFEQEAVRDALTKVFKAFGDNYIIQGCDSGAFPGQVEAGYIMLNGEILKVDQHTIVGSHFEKVTVFDSEGDRVMYNGDTGRAYQVNRAVVNASSGPMEYPGERLEDRIKLLLGSASFTNEGVVKLASSVEIQSGTNSTKAVTPLALHTASAWNTYEPINGWSGSIKYRKDNVGNVHYQISVDGAAKNNMAFMEVPEGLRLSDDLTVVLFPGFNGTFYSSIQYLVSSHELRSDADGSLSAYIIYSAG